jgi:hypothetical protein
MYDIFFLKSLSNLIMKRTVHQSLCHIEPLPGLAPAGSLSSCIHYYATPLIIVAYPPFNSYIPNFAAVPLELACVAP